MKTISDRISFNDAKDKTTIVILPPQLGWKTKMISVWLLLWYSVGIYITYQLFQPLPQQEAIILLVFLSFWLYFAFKVTKTFLWLTMGKEFIRINETSVSIKKSIRGYGKANPYYLENITKIRVAEEKENSFQSQFEKSAWVMGSEKIEFDHLGKTIKIGRKLDQKETKLLFGVLTKRIEQYLRKKNK